MNPGAPDPNPPAGRTFAVAMGVLGLLAAGLMAAAGVAVVKRINLPSELPPRAEAPPAGDPANPGQTPRPNPQYQNENLPPIGYHPRQEPISAPAIADDPDRPGTIYSPEILELVEIGVTLRRDGDMAGALQKLRRADELNPGHPRVLWELATVYRGMELRDKAEQTLAALHSLGPQLGGEFYELAAHSLGGSASPPANSPGARMRPAFTFGDTLVSAVPNEGTGERVLVRLAIQSSLDKPISPTDINVVVQFYDIVGGSGIDETRSDPPSISWPTLPADWADAGIEIVEWGYYMPVLTPEEIAAVGQRQYYGYVARLYYKDALQDVIAEPRTLLALPSPDQNTIYEPQAGQFLDDSLFPK